jgi:hypothetical protein
MRTVVLPPPRWPAVTVKTGRLGIKQRSMIDKA